MLLRTKKLLPLPQLQYVHAFCLKSLSMRIRVGSNSIVDSLETGTDKSVGMS